MDLIDRGVRNFVLELYDTGTANLRDSPYSLRRVFLAARDKGVHFFCTSQQEGIVDFSGYASSHELWREGHSHGPADNGIRVDQARRVL